jgi:hypothetical protein
MVVKAKQTTALKYCKYEQIKVTMMVKRTRQNRSVPDWPAYTASANTGLLFISPPKRSGFYAVSRTGLLWCSVNSSQIRYENRDGGGVSPLDCVLGWRLTHVDHSTLAAMVLLYFLRFTYPQTYS